MSHFPDTRVSVIEALGAEDPDQRRNAAELLVRAYRAPVLAALRWRWNLEPEDAEDLTHDFFAAALEKDWLARFDPARARFRTYLRLLAERFAANRRQAAGRRKRGGGVATVSLDDIGNLVSDGDDTADARFRAEWVRSVFALALEALRAEATARGRTAHLALFEAYELADADGEARPTYATLAGTHGLTETQVLNHLAWARRRFRAHVLDVLRRLAGSEAEYRADVRELLGVTVP